MESKTHNFMALVLSCQHANEDSHYLVSLVHFMLLGFAKALEAKLVPPNIQSTSSLGKTKFEL